MFCCVVLGFSVDSRPARNHRACCIQTGLSPTRSGTWLGTRVRRNGRCFVYKGRTIGPHGHVFLPGYLVRHTGHMHVNWVLQVPCVWACHGLVVAWTGLVVSGLVVGLSWALSSGCRRSCRCCRLWVTCLSLRGPLSCLGLSWACRGL